MSRTSKTWVMPKTVTPETALKNQIKQYLSIKGWFHFPVLQGLGAYKGIPDRIAVKNGRALFIEVKAPKGTQSKHQEEFQIRIEEAGFEYILVKSLEDLIEKNI